jgi:hypothetical protein
MKINRRIEQWMIEDVYNNRDSLSQADYQRNPRLWKTADKQRLIDSILTDVDIPKIYLNEIAKNQYEIIDGQQRLYAIWEFIDNEYKFDSEELMKLKGKFFDEFPQEYRDTILNYELQFTVIKNASDDYLRTLFLRLQLGLLLVVGEKLKAETGAMRDFIFNKIVKHPFIKRVNIKNIRYSKQALCAQICINSFRKAKLKTFSRTRYEDLYYFFREYKEVTGKEKQFFEERCKHILNVLSLLDDYFKDKAKNLRNRSLILSIYLFIEDFYEHDKNVLKKIMPLIVAFTMKIIERLKEEAKLGIHRQNEELYRLESYLSNAPGEKYQIKKRHDKLAELFEYFLKNKSKIKGDR